MGGRHLDIIREVDTRERPKNTICVGINWEKLSTEDVLNIAEVVSLFLFKRLTLLVHRE